MAGRSDNNVPTLDVSDARGQIFARGCAQFETVRKARPELVRGAIFRLRQTDASPLGRPIDRGEWVVRDAVPIYDEAGEPSDRVVLVLHRLADVYPGRGGRTCAPARQVGLFDGL